MTNTRTPIQFGELPYHIKVFALFNMDEKVVKFEVESPLYVKKSRILPTYYSLDYYQEKPNTTRTCILKQVQDIFSV